MGGIERYGPLLVAVLALAATAAPAQAAYPPCSPEWEASHQQAYAFGRAPTLVAVNRRVYFDGNPTTPGTTVADDSASYVIHGAAGRVPELYPFSAFPYGLSVRPTYLVPRSQILALTWAETDASSAVCQRTTTRPFQVTAGLYPRVIAFVDNDDETTTFRVLGTGAACAQTKPGAIKLVFRGPNATRYVYLRDACGGFTRAFASAPGWGVDTSSEYAPGLPGDYSRGIEPLPHVFPDAVLSDNFRSSGTRYFHVSAYFGRRLISRHTIRVVTRALFARASLAP